MMIPILTGVLGLSQHQAHGTSLAVMGMTALVSIAIYAWHGNVAWLSAGLIALTSAFTARYGARLARRTSPHGLKRAFAIFLAVVGFRLLWPLPHSAHAAIHPGLGTVLVDLVLGVFVGLLSGFMGVGGGILIVPALTLLMGLPQQLAQGTSLAVILVVAPVGAMEHARHGNVVRGVVPPLAIGAAVGGVIAAFLAQRVSGPALTRAFGVFLLLNAVHTWLRATPAAAKTPSPEPRIA